MLEKKTKALGYIMNILNITPTDLAKVLHIDRTNISKWVSGSRPFSSKSQHYSAVVEFILETNERQGQDILLKFFGNIYSSDIIDDGYLRRCIDKFLSSTEVPSSVFSITSQAKHSAYSCVAPVFTDADGRFAALMEMLSVAETVDIRESLILFDNKQFEWLSSNEMRFKAFTERMLLLLERGLDITVVFNSYTSDAFLNFLRSIYFFFSFKNFNEYHFTSTLDPNIVSTYYLLTNHMVVSGYHSKEIDQMYTIIMKDCYSVMYANLLINEIMNKCHKAIFANTDNLRYMIFDKIIQYEKFEEICYLYSPSLSLLSLSRELLEDILNCNNISGQIRTEFIKLYDETVSCLKKDGLAHQTRHLSFYQCIKDCIKQERIYYDELSVLLGREVYVTNNQFKRHLEDTANLLITCSNYSLGFIINSKPSFQNSYACKTKKNLYHVFCNRVLKYISEPNLVNTVAKIIENEWNENIPPKYKDRNEVANKLLQLSEACL